MALEGSYRVKCVKCGREFVMAPSQAMQSRRMRALNRGHGTCPKCKAFLHLEIEGGLEGERMVADLRSDEIWGIYLARLRPVDWR